MRFTKSDLHPTIFEAFNKWQTEFMYGFASQTADGKVGKMEVYNRHQKAWWKEYGKSVLLASAFWLLMIFGFFAAANRFDNKTLAIGSLLSMVGASAHGVWGYYKNKNTVTTDELEALLPDLKLNSLQTDYCHAFLDLFRNNGIAADHRREILAQMNTLLDESLSLQEKRKNLTEYLGDQETRTRLKGEVERLETRLGATVDPEAQETFRSSLEIAQNRLNRFGSSAPIVERMDAQVELISQTMGSLREVLVRLRNAPEIEQHDLESLRGRVDRIHDQGRILESAFDEIRALT